MQRRRLRRCPHWLWRWIDRRGRIPRWVSWLWPTAHWCLEMDSLLIIDNVCDCFCGHCGEWSRQYWEEFAQALKKRQADYEHNDDPDTDTFF